MEILRNLAAYQQELEDAIRLETTYNEVCQSKDGKKLLNYIKKRRRIMNSALKILNKYNT